MQASMQVSHPLTAGVVISLYERILNSLGYYDTGNGFLSFDKGVNAQPAMVNDYRLVLPNEHFLRLGASNQMAFHPICESSTRGESLVINKLRNMVNAKLAEMIGTLAVYLMELAVDSTRHSTMSPDQQELLKLLPDVSTQTLESLVHVIDAMDPIGNHRFVNVFLKRKGELQGVRYYRTAIVTFPILQEESVKEPVIFGVKVKSQKDKKAILTLFKYILNQIPTATDFSVGSHSGTAPFFHALINAFGNLARWLNEMLYDYRAHIPPFNEVFVPDLDWLEDVKDLTQYRGLIPPLPGNEGEFLEGMENQVQLQQPLGHTAATVTGADLEAERARKAGFRVGNKSMALMQPVSPNPGLNMGVQQPQKVDDVLAFTAAMSQYEQQRQQQLMINTPQGQMVYDPYNRETVLRARQYGMGQTGQQQQWQGVPSGVPGHQQRNRLSI